jgi:hypothetical protein
MWRDCLRCPEPQRLANILTINIGPLGGEAIARPLEHLHLGYPFESCRRS